MKFFTIFFIFLAAFCALSAGKPQVIPPAVVPPAVPGQVVPPALTSFDFLNFYQQLLSSVDSNSLLIFNFKID